MGFSPVQAVLSLLVNYRVFSAVQDVPPGFWFCYYVASGATCETFTNLSSFLFYPDMSDIS